MKRTYIIPLMVMLLIASVFTSCDGKSDKIKDKYSAKEIEKFLKTDLVIGADYDKSLLEISAPIDFCKTAEVNNRSVEDEEFLIDPMPAAENQGYNQCSGAASSYVLRFYGETADVQSVYDKINPKRSDGTVSPKPLKDFWDSKEDYKTIVFKGTVADLKDAVNHNIPVIVLINCIGGWHYVPVVGYDKDSVYIQDSIPEFRNEYGKAYNRKVTNAEFEELWNVALPYCDHLMFVITK